jgi:lipopolysaccharide heptosyltransferase II
MEHMEHSWVFLSERVPPVDMEIHAIERNLMMLESLGVRPLPIRYELPLAPTDGENADRLLAETAPKDAVGPRIAVNCAAKWPSKLWPETHFAQLADRLVETFHAHVVFTGSRADRPLVRTVLSRMHHPATDLTGKTSLTTLAALYQRVRFLISTDTGPMHLAAAVGIPVVAVFGPTAPWRTGPYGPQHRVVRAGHPCSPCFRRQCPTAMECMASVTPEQVFSAAHEILDG